MYNELYLKNIVNYLAILVRQIELRNSINLYDINILAEDFYVGLLNYSTFAAQTRQVYLDIVR